MQLLHNLEDCFPLLFFCIFLSLFRRICIVDDIKLLRKKKKQGMLEHIPVLLNLELE